MLYTAVMDVAIKVIIRAQALVLHVLMASMMRSFE
jgi:hypothetical protein